ncbi:MAG: Ig-like domain repeat protein, partial [Acidimicrobiales bacterium]
MSSALAVMVVAGTMTSAVVIATSVPAGASTIVTETFAGATTTSSSWLAGGTGTTACLTGGTNTSQTPIPDCSTTASSFGALRLTDNGGNESGYAMYNSAVPAASGLNITFDTYQFDTTAAPGADGISFFIVPGTTTLTSPGATGGYLGYGGGGTGQPTGENGVTNGILNIGLDVFGNNAWTGYDGGNCAAGDTSPYPLSAAGEPTGRVPESVTVRGPGDLQEGYCYVANSGDLATANPNQALDFPSATAPATTNAVQVNIVIPPPNATGPVPNITVTLTFPNASTYTLTAPEPPAAFIPPTFNFGFAASTGGSDEYHEINNLTVSTSIPNPGVSSVSPAQTAAGTSKTVTISGINFTGANSVTVDGVAATSFTVNSNTSITATLPAIATAGIYDVVVADGLATSDINSGDKFTYGASTTTLTSSSNPSVTGQTVTYSATAAPTAASGTVVPTGNIEFLDGSTPIAACGGATGVAVNASGVATCPVAYATIGTHSITAVYLGDTNYTGSTSTALTQTVNKASTTTTVTSSVNPSVVDQAVTYTATAAPSGSGSGTPTGNIEFLQGGTAIAACGGATGVATTGGVATCSVTYSATGTNSITATYLGDANYAGSTSTVLSQVVNTAPTTTTVTSSLNPSATGQSVTFTGTASSSIGTPTGNIEFLENGTAVAACGGAAGEADNGSGVATCAVTFGATGTDTLVAKYLGSATLSPSTSTTLTQTVKAHAST